MKIKEIQEIINFIKKSDLDDVSIETENIKIRVKKIIGISLTLDNLKLEKMEIKLKPPLAKIKELKKKRKKHLITITLINQLR